VDGRNSCVECVYGGGVALMLDYWNHRVAVLSTAHCQGNNRYIDRPFSP